MLYEIPILGLSLLGHGMVMLTAPELSPLPVPVRAGLAVLPTGLLAVSTLVERIPERMRDRLTLAGGALHLAASLLLPVLLVLRVVRGVLPVSSAVAALLGSLLLLGPGMLLSLSVLGSVFENGGGTDSQQ